MVAFLYSLYTGPSWCLIYIAWYGRQYGHQRRRYPQRLCLMRAALGGAALLTAVAAAAWYAGALDILVCGQTRFQVSTTVMLSDTLERCQQAGEGLGR